MTTNDNLDPLLQAIGRNTVITGVDLEHEVYPNEDGTFAFTANVVTEWSDDGQQPAARDWATFSPYANLEAVKAALLKLQNGANPWRV